MVIREGDVEVIRQGLTFTRYFTTEGVHPFDQVEWETRDAVIPNFKEGGNAFEQRDVEFPISWSQNATNIVAQKYFRGPLDTPQRESSVRQLVGRVVDTITGWGTKNRYFATDQDARVFAEELAHLLVNQKAAFNSPVWFNVGVPDTPQQCSACFILAVDDHMSSILNWYVEEGTIFKGGSGSGINLSRIRSSKEAAGGRRHRERPGELHARRRRERRHDQVRRQDAARRQDGDPQRRPPRRPRVHLVQGGRGAQGARPPRRRVRHGPRRARQLLDPVSEREQLGARHRRVHAGLRERRRLAPQGGQDRRDDRHGAGARADARDRAGRLGVRRSGHAVRHHDQRVAHVPGLGPDQRLEPVLGVHAPGQLRVQPRQPEPDDVPRRRRQLRRRELPARGRDHVHRAGDPRRGVRLPDRRRSATTRGRTASSGWATRTSAPC